MRCSEFEQLAELVVALVADRRCRAHRCAMRSAMLTAADSAPRIERSNRKLSKAARPSPIEIAATMIALLRLNAFSASLAHLLRDADLQLAAAHRRSH